MIHSRSRALERVEELLVEAVERSRRSWAEGGPMPPGYVTLLKETHKALIDGMKITGVSGDDAGTTPEQVLIQLEEARQRILKQIAMRADLDGAEEPPVH